MKFESKQKDFYFYTQILKLIFRGQIQSFTFTLNLSPIFFVRFF